MKITTENESLAEERYHLTVTGQMSCTPLPPLGTLGNDLCLLKEVFLEIFLTWYFFLSCDQKEKLKRNCND